MDTRIDYKDVGKKRIQPKKASLLENAFWFGLLVGVIYLCLITISNY